MSFTPSTSRMLSASIAALFAGALVGGAALVAACGEDSPAEGGEEAGPVDGSRKDARTVTDDGGPDPTADGGPAVPSDQAACNALAAYYQACSLEPPCGASFATWCPKNTTSVDSEAYRRGTVLCATKEHCSADDRKDCMYKSYADTTQSTSQKALTEAFCQMCEPGDLNGCRKRTTTYQPIAGPKSATSQFYAVWELSDVVVYKIRAKCTGTGAGASDGGADAGACAAAFDQCAADPYIDSLVECP